MKDSNDKEIFEEFILSLKEPCMRFFKIIKEIEQNGSKRLSR